MSERLLAMMADAHARAGTPMEHWIPGKDVAELLHISPNHVHERAVREGWPMRRLGRNIRYRMSEVLAYLESA